MSCRTTSGGAVSTALAKMVSGLDDKTVQHLFHALKREGEGQPAPSELALIEWRERQHDLLDRARNMSDKRKDSHRNKLFRSRTEPIPDGAMFYAWQQIEARARQEAVVQSIATAVDLAPPGSQADQYELGPDGRPVNVMYASYGSNLHRDRFMTYIQGGTPPGGRRNYPGCTDKTEPEFDIPIRYHGGFRAHFALTSSVWRGGIAFLDRTEDDETATALGRAYKLSIDQFDEVVHFENGGFVAKTAQKVPLDEVLTTGRSVTGPGAYETMLHIGDYQGMPVLTFTAPFSAHEALTRSGSLPRNNVRLPVMTNKPSPAYCRMIGQGLQETFGIDEVAAADYLRGMPGAATAYTRQEMVKVLRAPAAPATPPQPDKKVGYTPAVLPAFSGQSGTSNRYMDPDSVRDWVSGRKTSKTEPDQPKTRPTKAPKVDRDGVRYTPNKKGEYLPGVRTYPNASEQDEGVAAWQRKVNDLNNAVNFAQTSHAYWAGRDPNSAATRDSAAELERLTAAHAEAKAKHAQAKAQTPKQQFPPTDTYWPHQWNRMAEDYETKARVARNQLEREMEKDGGGSRRKVKDLEAKIATATARADEARAKGKAAQAKADEQKKATPSGNATTASTHGRTARKNGQFYPGVKTYTSYREQMIGVRGWQNQVDRESASLRRAEDRLAECEARHRQQPSEFSERSLQAARQWHAEAQATHTEAVKKYQRALNQNPGVTATSTPDELRRHLKETTDAIESRKEARDKAQAAIVRRGQPSTVIDEHRKSLARIENDLTILTRSRDAVTAALNAPTTNANPNPAPTTATTQPKTKTKTRRSKKRTKNTPHIQKKTA